jgi:hypothetical protein
VYLRLSSHKLIAALLLFVAFAFAGCGGGGGASESEQRIVRGAGYRFLAPAAWNERRLAREVAVSPQPKAEELVSVTVFPLVKPFRPALWSRVVRELDRAADQLARRHTKGRVESAKTVRVGGARAREYELAYTVDGRDLRNRIAFVLRGRTEYYLLCQWSAADDEPEACDLLFESFRPV